jgi:hypothetical protein
MLCSLRVATTKPSHQIGQKSLPRRIKGICPKEGTKKNWSEGEAKHQNGTKDLGGCTFNNLELQSNDTSPRPRYSRTWYVGGPFSDGVAIHFSKGVPCVLTANPTTVQQLHAYVLEGLQDQECIEAPRLAKSVRSRSFSPVPAEEMHVLSSMDADLGPGCQSLQRSNCRPSDFTVRQLPL